MGFEASPFDDKEDIPIISQPFLHHEVILGPFSEVYVGYGQCSN